MYTYMKINKILVTVMCANTMTHYDSEAFLSYFHVC